MKRQTSDIKQKTNHSDSDKIRNREAPLKLMSNVLITE